MFLKHQIYLKGDLNPTSDFVWAGNGIFRHAVRQEFTATVSYCPIITPGLTALEPKFTLLVPKIPNETVIKVLQSVQRYHNLERLFYLYWENSSWQLLEPEQVNSANACYALDSNLPPASIEIHSHGNNRAFFSEQDSLEEDGFRVSIVIGRNGCRLETSARVGVYGSFLNLDPTVILENINHYSNVVL